MLELAFSFEVTQDNPNHLSVLLRSRMTSSDVSDSFFFFGLLAVRFLLLRRSLWSNFLRGLLLFRWFDLRSVLIWICNLSWNFYFLSTSLLLSSSFIGSLWYPGLAFLGLVLSELSLPGLSFLAGSYLFLDRTETLTVLSAKFRNVAFESNPSGVTSSPPLAFFYDSFLIFASSFRFFRSIEWALRTLMLLSKTESLKIGLETILLPVLSMLLSPWYGLETSSSLLKPGRVAYYCLSLFDGLSTKPRLPSISGSSRSLYAIKDDFLLRSSQSRCVMFWRAAAFKTLSCVIMCEIEVSCNMWRNALDFWRDFFEILQQQKQHSGRKVIKLSMKVLREFHYTSLRISMRSFMLSLNGSSLPPMLLLL